MIGGGELLALRAGEDGAHVGAPDGNREVGAVAGPSPEDDALLSVVGASGPDGGGVLRAKAHKPEVGVVVRGARLAGNGLVGAVVGGHDGRGALGDDRLEDIRGVLGDRGVDDLLGLVLVLIDDVPVAVLDLGDRHGVAVDAAARNHGVGLAHVKRRHLRRAKARRKALVDRGVDAHRLCHLDYLVHADGLCDLHVAGVGGDGGGMLERADAVVVVVDVARGPRGRDLQCWHAVDQNARAHARIERGEKNDALEARARLTEARGKVDRALSGFDVIAVVLATHHGNDVAVGVVDRDERSGKV